MIRDFSSDIAIAPTRDVATLVKGWNPDFVATVGDNNYPDGAASTIDENVGQWYQQFISPYTGSYGSGASGGNKFYPAIGNHDYNSASGYSPYVNYFALPGNERYYSTVQGNVQIFVVNSDSNEPNGTSSTSTQGQWLKNALAGSTAQWKIVLFHHPAYSSGSQGSNSFMQWPFQAWGASAVISGHAHDYERIIKNGFPYFVNGLGGESLVGFSDTVSGSAVRYNGDYGAMLINTTSTTATFQFINRAGQQIDSYTISSGATVVPMAPTGLSATATASAEVRLTWTDASPGVTGSFKVERSSNGGTSFSVIASTVAGITTYLDQGLAPGGSYVYRIRASNSAGDSPPSAAASVTLPTGSTTYVSDLPWVSSTNGWGPVERDTSCGSNGAGDGRVITLNGVTYAKGLGAHAVSSVVINLNKQYDTFFSDIGVDDETGPGTVIFQVLADGIKVYDSGIMSQAGVTKSVSVDVRNVTQLTLVVANGGDDNDYDHADWANARLQTSSGSPPPETGTFIATGSTWKYLDNGTNQNTAWRAIAFDDSTWKSGAAQLGYGDGDESTVVGYGPSASSKFVTTYFRKSFSVADASQVSALALGILRDDGAVVYVNGTEIYRGNLPTGAIAYNTLASDAIEDNTFYSKTFSNTLLTNGTNVIAVEVHQAGTSSSDISFDFKLTGTVTASATLASSAPSQTPFSTTQIAAVSDIPTFTTAPSAGRKDRLDLLA